MAEGVLSKYQLLLSVIRLDGRDIACVLMGMRSCKDQSYPSPQKLGVKVKRKEDAFFKKIGNKFLKFLWRKIKSENKHKHLEKGK